MTSTETIEMRAATDPEFRAALVADPKAVLASLGIVFREGVEVSVEESTPTELVLCLPPAIETDVELSEDAMAGVAGGTTPLTVFATVPISAISTGALIGVPLAATGGGILGYGLSRL